VEIHFFLFFEVDFISFHLFQQKSNMMCLTDGTGTSVHTVINSEPNRQNTRPSVISTRTSAMPARRV
jgi:hypothetical protein